MPKQKTKQLERSCRATKYNAVCKCLDGGTLCIACVSVFKHFDENKDSEKFTNVKKILVQGVFVIKN